MFRLARKYFTGAIVAGANVMETLDLISKILDDLFLSLKTRQHKPCFRAIKEMSAKCINVNKMTIITRYTIA